MIEGISNDQVAFVILAGFAPNNKPVLALQNEISALGYRSVALPFWGNIETPNFSKLTIEDCNKNIADAISNLSKNHKIVIGIGVSLGGALLLEYAKTSNNLDYIVSIGTPFKLKNTKLIHFAFKIYPAIWAAWKIAQKFSSEPLSPIASGKMVINYFENDFIKDLEKVTTPVLLLQSRNDNIVDYTVLEKYLDQFSSLQKKVIYFENTDHVIGYDHEIIIRSVVNFVYFVTELSKEKE